MFARLTFSLSLAAVPAAAFAQHTQFGGPAQDFKFSCSGLLTQWPESGPPQVWSREIGEGYSGIVVEGDRLYTMYRGDDREVVACLDAGTGKTVWEHAYDAPVHEGHEKAFNAGPRASPALHDGKVYAVGCFGMMHCLDAKTGRVRWSHDLWKEFNGSVLNHGYSSTPFIHKGSVIAMVGGQGHGLMAFDADTGSVKWKRHDYRNSYSTPKLINVDGQDQLLCFMAAELVAIDPVSGDELWQYKIGNQWGQNISLPLYGPDNILFISVEQAGSRGLKLSRTGGKTTVDELWSNRRLRLHHSNAVRIGDYVYASTGGMGGPGLLQAVNVKTGEIAWRERGFSKANCLWADGRLLLLDEDGTLGLVTVSPEFMEINAKAKVLEPAGQSRAWTAPTLAGKTLFVRDSRKIAALKVGA